MKPIQLSMSDTITRMHESYITGEKNGEPWIACRTCGLRSYNPSDVENLYCGKCHVFHEDQQ
jgi:ribosomal protein L37E